MKFIAFDTATQCGIAYRDEYGDWHTDVLDPYSVCVADAIRNARDIWGITAAILEGCYLGKNAHTFGKLSEIQGRIKLLCEQAGLSPIVVYQPSEWQASFGISAKNGGNTKDGSRVTAIRLGAAKGLSADEYDAICLCDYAESMAKLEGE